MPRLRFLVDEDPGADQSIADSTTWQNVNSGEIGHENPELEPSAKMWLIGIHLVGGDDVSLNTAQTRVQIETATLADSTARREPRRTSQTSGAMYFMSRIFSITNRSVSLIRIEM